jgi:hypothetical protein
MTATRGAALASLLVLSACPILSLEDLEKDNPSSCGAMMSCIDGWHCGADGHCHENVMGACSDGDSMGCGSSVGECRPGTQTCASGKFGACMGSIDATPERCDGKDNDCNGSTDDGIVDGGLCLTQKGVCAGSRVQCVNGNFETTCSASNYGTGYELVEMSCDGKDNDCDGTTDQGLVQACPLDAGVCAGTQVACLGGAFAQCTAATYAAHNGLYESFEKTCDGLDNDCDGLVDAWAPQNVSSTPGHVSRRPQAVLADFLGDVLVLWEEEKTAGNFTLQDRLVHRDGTMSAAASPAATVVNAVSAGPAALAVDGNIVGAAWVELSVRPDGGMFRRIQMATLDPTTGRSTLTGEASLQAAVVDADEVAVAVDAAQARMTVAWTVAGALTVAAFPLPLGGSALFTTSSVATGVQGIQLAPAGGGLTWLTYFVPAMTQVQHCLIPSSGLPLACPSPAPSGKTPTLLPLSSSSPYYAESLFTHDIGSGIIRIASTGCDGGSCTGPMDLPIPQRQNITALRAAATVRTAPASFIAWEESSSDYHFFVLGHGDGGVQPTAGANQGRRPVPVYTGDSSHGVVVFDTESTPGAIPSDDVFLARYCL